MGRSKPVMALVATLATGVALSACGGGDSGQDGATEITVGIIPVADAGGYFVADAQGLFEKHGLTVTASNIAGGAALVPALESGATNVGFSNLVSVLQSAAQGFNTKCIAGTLRKPVTGRNLALVVSPVYADEITTARDLEGKTIAANTLGNINQLVAQAWMADSGADAGPPRFVAVNFPDMPVALMNGDVAAAVTDEPFTTVSLEGGAKLLEPRPYQAIAADPVFSCWLVDGAWLEENRSAAEAFVAALEEADAYLEAHPDYLREILPDYTSLSPELASQIELPAITTEMRTADLAAWVGPAREFGLIDKEVDVDSILVHLGSRS